MLQGVVECEFVTLAAQTADNADREVGEIRVMPEFFPCKHVGKMHLDKRNRDCRQRIAHGRASSRVDARQLLLEEFQVAGKSLLEGDLIVEVDDETMEELQ